MPMLLKTWYVIYSDRGEGFILFFYQIILHFSDLTHSGVTDDKHMPYYLEVERWSNLYTFQLGFSGSHVHFFNSINL